MPTVGQQYIFKFGPSIEYMGLAQKNSNALYFLTDTRQIYLGDTLYSGTIYLVTTFPETGLPGILYCNSSTNEIRMWNNDAWLIIVPEVSNIIESSISTYDANLATISAIKNYVSQEIGSPYTLVKQETADEGYASTYQLFKGTTPIGDKININKDKVISQGEIKFVTVNDQPYQGASIGDPYFEFIIANSNESKLYVPAKNLVEFPTVTNSNSVNLTMSSAHQISADVRRSSQSGNVIQEETDGLYVATPYIVSSSDTSSILLNVDNSNNLTATVKLASITPANQELKLNSVDGGLYVDLHDKYYTKSEINSLLSWNTL